jgi:hypothetical protein
MKGEVIMSWKFGVWVVAPLLLIVLSLVTATRFATLGNKGRSHPPDEILLENFRRHEADFNRLVSMSEVDSKVIRIADDFTWLDTNANWPRPDSEIGFSRERWGEYRRIFSTLGLSQGLLRPLDTDTIYLIASSNGNLTSGSSKGYAYSIKPLSPLSDSLDHVAPELRNQQTLYKKLGANWYLFYMSN